MEETIKRMRTAAEEAMARPLDGIGSITMDDDGYYVLEYIDQDREILSVKSKNAYYIRHIAACSPPDVLMILDLLENQT